MEPMQPLNFTGGTLNIYSMYLGNTGIRNPEPPPNGMKIYGAEMAELTRKELETCMYGEFSYGKNLGLNKSKNSISLVPRVRIDLPSGMQLVFRNTKVNVIGDIPKFSSAAKKEAMDISGALSYLTKYANGQVEGITMDRKAVSEYAIKGLQIAGIDTTKPFYINETKFYVDEYNLIQKAK